MATSIGAIMTNVQAVGSGFLGVGGDVLEFLTGNALGVIGIGAGITLFGWKLVKRIIPFI